MDTQSNEQVTSEADAEVTTTTIGDDLRAAFEAAQKPQEQAKEPVKEVTEEKPQEEATKEEPAVEDEEKKIADTVESEFPLIPKDWSQEEKDVFQSLLDSEDEDKALAAQVFIERYNLIKKGFYKKTREYSESLKEVQPINEVFKPYEETMKKTGVTKAQYIQNMMQWDNVLHKDPVSGVKQIMAAFNLKPEQFLSQDVNWDLTEEPSYGNNKVAELEAQVKFLQNQLAALPIETQIRQFAEATDSEGKLKHPYFKEVQSTMGGIMASNPKLTLEQAYAKAVKTLDLEASQDTPDQAVSLDRIREKVAKAKKAAKGVRTSNGGLDFSQMSLADELKARFSGIK